VIDDHLGTQLEHAVKKVESSGDYEIGGEHYKRVPPGFDRNHLRSDYLKFNSLYSKSKTISIEILQDSVFVDTCFAEIKNMLPIHKWLVSTWKLSFL
jgi:hypothetical protein